MAFQRMIGIGVLALLCAGGPVSAQVTFRGLGIPSGFEGSFALDVSDDGSVVVGHAGVYLIGAGTRAFRWTESTGTVILPDLPGQAPSIARAVTSDGIVVVGESGSRPVRWQGSGANALASPGTGGGSARGISGDGTQIVGSAWTSLGGPGFAARLGEPVALPLLLSSWIPGYVGQCGAIAYSTATDRRICVGSSCLVSAANTQLQFPVKWDEADAVSPLATFGSGGVATSISPDGGTIVGYLWLINNPINVAAVKWASDGVPVALERVGADVGSYALAVARNGTVTVGWSWGGVAPTRAVRWTANGRAQVVKSILLVNNTAEVEGWELTQANGVSSDGRFIVGEGINPFGQREAWIASIPVQCVADVDDGSGTNTPDGGVTIDDLLYFLARFEAGC